MKIEFDTNNFEEVLKFLIDLKINELKEPRINICIDVKKERN